MKIRNLVSAVTVGTLLLTSGCSDQPPAVKQAAKHLNSNGTYYYLADKSNLPQQIDFMLERTRPDTEKLLAAIPANVCPFQLKYDLLLEYTRKFIQHLGLDKIKAVGASSVILTKDKDNKPAVYHNRFAMAVESDKIIPLLMICQGHQQKLGDIAAQVPDNALNAAAGSFNLRVLWDHLDGLKIIPQQVSSIVEIYTGCKPAEFLAGISGQFLTITMSMDPLEPQLMYQLPDKDNRLFNMAAKFTLQDAGAGELALPANITQNKIDITLVKGKHKLTVYCGKNTRQLIESKVSQKQTMANFPAFKRNSARIPAEALFYSIGRFAPGAKNATSDECIFVAASNIDETGIKAWSNNYTDANGLPFEIAFTILSNVQSALLKAVDLLK